MAIYTLHQKHIHGIKITTITKPFEFSLDVVKRSNPAVYLLQLDFQDSRSRICRLLISTNDICSITMRDDKKEQES